MTAPAPKPRAPGWMKLLLALSLAVNLAVAGLVGGIALRRAADSPGAAPWRAGADAAVGLRHALAALPEDDRRALRVEWRTRMRDVAVDGSAPRPADAESVLALLRADDLDTEALRAALEAPQARARIAGQEATALVVKRIAAMAPAERAAYADRLEERLDRGGRGRWGRPR